MLDVNNSAKIPTQPGYEAVGGYYREEAILALRRFYITSNANGRSLLGVFNIPTQEPPLESYLDFVALAPKPRNKATRVLKTEFLPIKSRTASPSPQASGHNTPTAVTTDPSKSGGRDDPAESLNT